MTKIKLCGLSRLEDIEAVNALNPEYIGFVFANKSKRYVDPQKASELKQSLSPKIKAVGVFVNEDTSLIAKLLNNNIIDIAQLHGNEDNSYINQLRTYTDKPIIQAFRIETPSDVCAIESSSADYVLLDSGAGTGTKFDWSIIKNIKRPYFLAGGLSSSNVAKAISLLHPYAVDTSSGIETNGLKDKSKMHAFIDAVRKEDRL